MNISYLQNKEEDVLETLTIEPHTVHLLLVLGAGFFCMTKINDWLR